MSDHSNVPTIWAVTFGQKYRREPHPTLGVISPSAFAVLQATDIDQAFALAHEAIGRDFSHIYRYETDEDRAEHDPHFPLGPTISLWQTKHNHMTRDIKAPGPCPKCDEHHA